MSVTVKQKKSLPPLRGRPRMMGNIILPHTKGQLSARPEDMFKKQKVRGEDVQIVLKFLQDSFDLAPTTTPADTVCKLRLKMSNTYNKIKQMKEQLMDHDVLLLDVQDELDLGPEVNPVMTSRAFKKYIRTSKEHTARLEKTIKGNDALLKACKEIAGVSGHHAPAGLANFFRSNWSRQCHVISKLKNTIQDFKENSHSLSKKNSAADIEESILDLARAMGVNTSNNSHISIIVAEMKGTFMTIKGDVISLNDMLKVKKEEIQNVQDCERTQTNRIVELESELDDLKKRNQYLTFDLEQAKNERQSASNSVDDLEHKIREIQIDNDRKALEIEALLQRYEEAGKVVVNLQSELDDTIQLNQFLNMQIKALDSAKENDVADLQQQKKDLESKLESLRTAEFQTNAQVLSLKLELSELKTEKDDANVELKKLQTTETKKDNRILELEKEIAILQKQKQELESNLETLKSKDARTDPSNPATPDTNTPDFSWKSEYNITGPKAHDRTESQLSSLVVTLERRVSDLELEKKNLTSQLQNRIGNDSAIAKTDHLLVEKKVFELRKQKKELRQQLKNLHQEKDDLISQHEVDVNRLMMEKFQLATHLQAMIDQRRESIALIQQCAADTEASDNLLRQTMEDLKTALKDKEVLLAQHSSEVYHFKSELKHLKSNLKEEKEKHHVMTQNAQRQKKVENELIKHEDNQAKVEAMTRQNDKLRAKITLLKTKMADISAELQQSRQDSQKMEKNFAKACQQCKELEYHVDVVKKEKDELSSRVKILEKENKESDDKFTALNEEMEQVQSHSDSLKEERDELSAQLCKAHQQCQQLEDKFTAVEQEIIEPVQKRSEIVKEERHEQSRHQLTKARQQHLELDEKFPGVNMKKEPAQTHTGSPSENKDDISAQLEEANKQYQALEEEFDVLHQEKLDFQSLADSLAEDNYKLSTDIAQAYKDVHALEDRLNSADEESENQQELSTKLKEENANLSTSLESIRDLCKDLHEEIESLNESNKKLRQQNNSVESKDNELFEELEQSMELCQNLEEKVAAAAREKAEFEQEAAKREKEKGELLAQLQSIQNQYQVMKDQLESANQDGENRHKLASQLIEEKEELSTQLAESHQQCQEADARLSVIHKAAEKLDHQIAEIQNDRKELKEKLDTSEKDRSDLSEKNNAAMKKLAEVEELKIEANEKNKKLQSEVKELEGKASTMVEMIELLEKKASLAETRHKETEEELQSMKASVTAAAIQYGILETVGDSICIADLFQALEDMKQLNAHLKIEIVNLKKTKATFEEMINIEDPFLERGDSVIEKSPGERERCDLKEMVEDLRYQTCKQDNLIKKLRYHLSVLHKRVLKEKDSIYSDMAYLDRAVVERICAEQTGSDLELRVIKPDDLAFVVEADIDEDDDLIGKGAYGKVFLRQYEGEAVAVKVPYVNEGVKDADDEMRLIRIKADHARTTMEALVHLALADHPSFPKTIGVVDFEGAPSLVLEFLGDKRTGTIYSLGQAIKFQIPALSKENWFDIITDIVHGVKAMHEKGLLHNDLKSNNILLQWDLDDHRWHAFIIDMGKVSTELIPLRHNCVPKEEIEGYKDGTLFQNLAPEYILDLQPMTVQTEIYSLGKLLARIEKVIRNRTLRELAADMTNVKPRLRPSWKRIEKVITKAQKRNLS